MNNKIIKGDYGSIKVDDKGNVVSFERGATLQGFVYKNLDEFKPSGGVCYIPELSDTMYTYDDFMDICDKDYGAAITVFDVVDWQHVETAYDEMKESEDI